MSERWSRENFIPRESGSGPVRAPWRFETVQNRRSTAIEVQDCVYLSTTSCGRQELNECLTDRYVFTYIEVEFAKFS